MHIWQTEQQQNFERFKIHKKQVKLESIVLLLYGCSILCIVDHVCLFIPFGTGGAEKLKLG